MHTYVNLTANFVPNLKAFLDVGFRELQGPPPELLPEPEGVIKRGYLRGTVVRVKLKNGTVWLGEVVRETKVDLKISVGGSNQLLDFEDMASVEELSHR